MPRGNNNKLRLQRNMKEQRLEIVAPLWRKNYTYREIQAEVRKRLGLDTYALCTVKHDVDTLLQEWQENRLEDTDKKVTSELARIDLVIREAWDMWEKSKVDYEKKKGRQHGKPIFDEEGTQTGVKTSWQELYNEEFRACGDARYLDIIIRCIERRCKLLGLDKETVDLNAQIGDGRLEIVYVSGNDVGLASSEEEVRRREGLDDI